MCSENLQTIIINWLHFLKNNRRYSSHTILAYQQDLSSFCNFLIKYHSENLTLKHIEDVSLTTLRAWLADRLHQGLTPRSTARAISAVKGFFRHLQRYHQIVNTAIASLKSPRLQKTLPRPLDMNQVTQLLDEVQMVTTKTWVGYRDRALFMLLYASGLRISEALSLKASQNPLSSQIIITGKGGKQRMIPILPQVTEAIALYVQHCPYALVGNQPLFVGERGGQLNPSAAQKTLRLYRRLVGFPESVTPHALRHTCATHLMQESHDLRSIQELLGHASLSSTQIYTNLDQQQLLKTYKKFHPRQRQS